MKTHPISLKSKKCGIEHCEFKGDNNSLIRHQENIHGKIVTGRKKCSRCDYSTNTADKLNKHTKRCSMSSELFNCESCEYKSGTSLGLSIHFKNSHPNQKLYKKCSRCDYASDSDYKLNLHEKRCLKSDKLFKCEECGHKSGTPLALSLHIKNIHPDLIFRCENCDFITQKLSDFESHSRNCAISSCFICDFTSYKKSVMKTHLELEHKLTNFDCDLCSYETKELTKLNTHIEAVHLGKKNFKCKLCDFATGWPTLLKKHMKTHFEEPRKCEIEDCDVIANNKQELKNHMKDNHGMEIDNDLEKFKCQKCDYRSNFTNSIRRHWKLCEKVEDLQNCEHCEQKFGTKLCLGKHLKKAHPGQAKVNSTSVKSNITGFQCTKCDYVSREAKKLDRHWKTCLQTKGQLISKGNFGVFKSTRNQRNFVRISSLASKKRSNQKK